MKQQLIVLRGPFTEDEVTQIVGVMRRIEARRPEETFEVLLHADEDDVLDLDVVDLLERLNPLRAGYERTVKRWRIDE